METASDSRYRSRYGIEKLQDHNYHTWSFQCQMLLSEKKVWSVITEDRPIPLEELPTEEMQALTAGERRDRPAEVEKWRPKNEEALRIISFTVCDRLQGPIIYSKTAKSAWEELQKIHAPKDKQLKFSLLKRLYRLDMRAGSTLT